MLRPDTPTGRGTIHSKRKWRRVIATQEENVMNRFKPLLILVIVSLLLAACGPTPTPLVVTVEVEKEVEKEVIKEVGKVVEVTPTLIGGQPPTNCRSSSVLSRPSTVLT
jgi:hypothetical protein